MSRINIKCQLGKVSVFLSTRLLVERERWALKNNDWKVCFTLNGWASQCFRSYINCMKRIDLLFCVCEVTDSISDLSNTFITLYCVFSSGTVSIMQNIIFGCIKEVDVRHSYTDRLLQVHSDSAFIQLQTLLYSLQLPQPFRPLTPSLLPLLLCHYRHRGGDDEAVELQPSVRLSWLCLMLWVPCHDTSRYHHRPAFIPLLITFYSNPFCSTSNPCHPSVPEHYLPFH